MNRLTILLVIALSCFTKAWCEEFKISYNEGTDQPYSLIFKTLDDALGTVEISNTEFSNGQLFEDAWYTVDVVEFPSSVSYNGQDFTVTTLNIWGLGSYYAGPKKIIIPSSIRWIKSNITSPLLEEVVIDNAPIEELPEMEVFHNCSELKTVSFGNACLISKIPISCFENCPSLTSVQLPESIEKIEPYAFLGCISLEKVEYKEEGITELGYSSFQNCESLKYISFPAVSIIGESAFQNCKSLTSITLSTKEDSDIRFGSHAFENCEMLNEIAIEASAIKEIGEAAFNNCSSLKSFSLPSDCERIGSKAFAGCSSLEQFEVTGEGGSYSAIDGVLVSDGFQLLAYPAGKKEADYSVPANLTAIASGAFEGAANLSNVSLNDNITSLGVMAFRDCKALKQVNLSDNLDHLPSGTFSGCSALEEVTIPDNYIFIGTSSFQDCSSLSSVKLPSELKVLGDGAFVNCSNIESIELPDQMTEIRSNTFRNCESLKTIKLSAKLDTIHSAALQGCKSLQRIELSESLKSLEERAFKGCESLGNLTIPDGVTQVGTNAFEDCSSLKEVVVGNGVKEIGQWAFYNCTDMEKLVLGSSVETIGAEAFEGDINIRDITCLSPEPPTFPGGFPEEVTENATVTVPEGSEDAYNASPVWDEMVEGEVPKAETIELNIDQIKLVLKDTFTLTATVYPEDAVDKTVVWTSKDYEVAKVDDDGLVTAKGLGGTEIVATCGKASASCRVTVIDDPEGIEYLFSDSDAKVEVFDLNGILVKTAASLDDIRFLKPAIYILRSGNSTKLISIAK